MNKRNMWLSAMMAVILLAALLGGIIWVPRLLYPPLGAGDLRGVSSAQSRIQLQQAQSQLANNARSTVLQGLAGLLLVVGAIATWRQIRISREGQITERFTRAVDQLGNQNVDVRVGGIYALERIAKDSEPDRNSIQFLLGAFIRNHASWPPDAPDGPQHPTPAVDDRLPRLRVRAPDVQVAIAVLARRPRSRDERVLNLPRVDLRGVSVTNALLDGASLQESNLARAELINARLKRADLTAADLREASLDGAYLTDANLTGAYLQGADLRRAHLRRANLSGADLSRANLRGTDLTGAILDGTVLTSAQADSATIWPPDVNAERRRELGVLSQPGWRVPR
jgi:hypothetical protein